MAFGESRGPFLTNLKWVMDNKGKGGESGREDKLKKGVKSSPAVKEDIAKGTKDISSNPAHLHRINKLWWLGLLLLNLDVRS